MSDMETRREAPKFGLVFMFCLTGYFAIYFAASQAFGLSNYWIVIGFLMASIRLPLIFLAGWTKLSIPLLVFFFLIPIGALWQNVDAARSSMISFASPAQWLTIGTFYFLGPSLVLYADMRGRYTDMYQQLLRLIVDAVLMTLWVAVTVSHFLR
jgi:hypothetical protein